MRKRKSSSARAVQIQEPLGFRDSARFPDINDEEQVMKRMTLAAALVAICVAGSVALGGAIGGPAFAWKEFIGGYQLLDYHVAFSGGEWAQVTVAGADGAALDLLIYDEFGNLIAADFAYADSVGGVTFFVAYPRVYKVRVVNRSGSATMFHIMTN
jgi:hypothetical protein